MNLLLHAVPMTFATAVGYLISAILEGAVLALCVALCLHLLPGLGAAARSLIWTNVFLLLVLLYALPSLEKQGASLSAFSRQAFHLAPFWSVAIAVLWAVLSLWRALQLVSSALRLRGVAARAIPVDPDPSIQALLKGTESGRRAALCTSTEVDRPSVFGFFRPRILLPPRLLRQLTALELKQVVLHEMEHLRRADDWTNLLQKLGLVLFPLNPVLLWVEHRLCAEREHACDDRVLNLIGARKSYAVCLTRLAEFSMLRRNLSLALGALERQSALVRRVHRILRKPHPPMRPRQAIVLTGSLMLGVVAGAILLARTPQFVSFAPRTQAVSQALWTPVAEMRPLNLGEFSGTPTLVKAVMPQRPAQIQYVASHRHLVAAKQIRRQPSALPRETEWIVLTEWEDSLPPPRIIFAIAPDHRSTYAAVATANGWLIIQI